MIEIFKALKPFDMKGFNIKNRFIRSAVNDHLGNTDGTVSDAQIELYDKLGKGNIGIIITGHMSVAPDLTYRADIAQTSIGDNGKIAGIKRIADKIHQYGSLAIAQISMAGSKGLTPFDFNELSTEQMKEIRQWFVEAAVRAKEAGFDGVQVHIAHWYLLQAVVNVDLNQRTDCYGGSDENRIRMPHEIVEGIREKCGIDFIIMVKMNAHNTADGIDDYSLLSKYVGKLKDAGVDLVEISGTDFARKDRKAELYYLEAARYLRFDYPDLTISLVGGIYNLHSINESLRTTDFVSLGRALLTQPDLINKLMSAETDQSRCIHCNKCFEIFATKHKRCIFGDVIPKLEETFPIA